MVFLNVNGGPFRVYEMFMKAIGVWPLDRNPRRSTLVFLIIALAQIAITVTNLIHPLKKCFPIDVRNYRYTYIIGTITGVLRLINLRVFGPSMIPLIETTIADWSMITVPKERDILKQHNRAGLFVFYGVMGLFAATFAWRLKFIPFIAEFILMNKWEACAFNDNLIWLNLLSVITQISTLFSQLTSLVSFMLFWSFAMHLSARFKILKNQIQDCLLLKVVEPLGRKELRRIVDNHNQILDLSRHLENSFTVFLAFMSFELQLLICTMMFQTLTDDNEIFSMTVFYRYVNIILMVARIYLYYYAGDFLSACSEEIGEVFTQCNWTNLSKKSIKDYSIIIARCQKPCTLTAVKIYKLNLSNLRYVFHGIYSYVTCIAAVVKATRK